MDKWISITLAVMFVCVATLLIYAGVGGSFAEVQTVPLTCAETRQQFDAYRMCMQTADSTGCTMTVEDFLRHAELERELEECENVN
jgi:hypothetical protein